MRRAYPWQQSLNHQGIMDLLICRPAMQEEQLEGNLKGINTSIILAFIVPCTYDFDHHSHANSSYYYANYSFWCSPPIYTLTFSLFHVSSSHYHYLLFNPNQGERSPEETYRVQRGSTNQFHCCIIGWPLMNSTRFCKASIPVRAYDTLLHVSLHSFLFFSAFIL